MMRSQSPKASEVCNGGCCREQSVAPLLKPFSSGYRRAVSVGVGSRTTRAPHQESHRPSPSTPPEDRVLYATMERLFEAYRRYERSQSEQNATWTPSLSGGSLERQLVAEFNRVRFRNSEDVRRATKQQRRCRPETKTPASSCDSKTVGPTRNGQATCSKPSSASRQVALMKPTVPQPTTRAKTRRQRPEVEIDIESTVCSNVTDFTPPRTSVLSTSSAVGYGSCRTRSLQPSSQSSVTTTKTFQTDSCRPRSVQRQPVSTRLSSGTAVCVSGRQQKITGDSSVRCGPNTSTTAAVQSRPVSVDRTLLTRQRSEQVSGTTTFNPSEITSGSTNRGPSRPCGGATSQMTSAQRLSRCDLPRSRAAVTATRADATQTTTSEARRSDGRGRVAAGCDTATTRLRRQRISLSSQNHIRSPLITARSACNDSRTSNSISDRRLALSENRKLRVAVKNGPQVPLQSRFFNPRCANVTTTERCCDGITGSRPNHGSSNGLKLTKRR